MPSVPVVTESAATRIAYPPVLPVEEVGIDIAAPFGEGGHEGQRVAHLAEDDTGGDRRRAPSQHVGGHHGDGVEIDGRVGHLETVALRVQCGLAAVSLGRMPCVGKTRGIAFEEHHLERGGVAQSGVGIALQTDDRRAGQRHVCHVDHEGGRVGAKEIGCNNGKCIGATDSVNYRCYTICSNYGGVLQGAMPRVAESGGAAGHEVGDVGIGVVGGYYRESRNGHLGRSHNRHDTAVAVAAKAVGCCHGDSVDTHHRIDKFPACGRRHRAGVPSRIQ